MDNNHQFSVPQIEYPLGGSSKTGSQVKLPVDCCHGTTIVMSNCTIATSEHLYQTIVQFDDTIVSLRKLATGNIHDYLSWYYPLVGILFEVLRIGNTTVNTG